MLILELQINSGYPDSDRLAIAAMELYILHRCLYILTTFCIRWPKEGRY